MLALQIRPTEVIATQNFDEADRMDITSGDRIIVIDGRAENFWWRGQNRRTGEISSFPREIVRLQRSLECESIHCLHWASIYTSVKCAYSA